MSIAVIPPFFRRFVLYSMVGVGTYLFDLILIYCFKTFLFFPDPLAVGLGFLIAVSTNFLISYLWVFKGTHQTKLKGYLYFIAIATIGLTIIVVGTMAVKTFFSLDLYVARTIIAGFVGTLNYTLNALFNFKMID